MNYRITLLIAAFLLLACCSENLHDKRLEHIAGIVSDTPEEALSQLDSIDRDALWEADRNYYDLLTIKAKDKAYIRHTSDTLIKRVIDYYSNHGDIELYAEALYYGGRVYSDMGDSPNALRYFHNALDTLPDEPKNHDLKGNIVSQTGRLLTSLGLFEEAIPYIKDVIELERLNKDTINLIYDLQLLGSTNFLAGNYRAAEATLHESLTLCPGTSPYNAAKSRMYLGAVKYALGQVDSALFYIRNTPDEVKPNIRNSALEYASDIYLKTNILDTALLYARELINDPEAKNPELGYQVILSPKIRSFYPLDTLEYYLYRYIDVLVTYYDKHQAQLALNQQSLFNYKLHDKGRQKAEKDKEDLEDIILAIALIASILAIALLILKIRHQRTLIKLHIALDQIKSQQWQNSETSESETYDFAPEKQKPEEHPASLSSDYSLTALRNRLRDTLYDSYLKNPDIEPSGAIICSEAYQELRNNLKEGINDDNDLWKKLESVILNVSPNFKTNLHLLTGGHLSAPYYHTALLIKCHFPTKDMAALLQKTKGTVVSRRETLCQKVFGENKGVKIIDGIIRHL